MNEELTIQQTYKRIQRVRSAGWLSLMDMCFLFKVGANTMRRLILRDDFPRPSCPTGTAKGRRWNVENVSQWFENREQPKEEYKLAPLMTKEIIGKSVPFYQGPGVYFLIKSGTVVYVGKSKKISHRIGSHVASGKEFDSVNVIEADVSELDDIERHYIKKFKPKFNKAGLS